MAVVDALPPTAVPVTGDVWRPTRRLGKFGRFWLFADTPGVPSFTLNLYGRSDPGAPWYKVETITMLLPSPALDRNTCWSIPLFPEMYADLTAVSTTINPITFTAHWEE